MHRCSKVSLLRGFRRLLSDLSSKNYLDDAAYQVTTYARPRDLCITRGFNAKVFDDINGREYIDLTSGIGVTALGHSNPKVSEILYRQAQTLVHSSNLYYNVESLELSRKLVESTKKFGGQHDASRVFLCNSGTEANEAALKFAKKYGTKVSSKSKKQGILAFNNSFHGRSMGSLSVTSAVKYRAPFEPLVPGVTFLNIEDDLGKLQGYISDNADRIAGLIIEPIQGEGGVFPVPMEKLVGIKSICSQNDIIVIYDEIQCGMGRSGKLWAHSYLPREAHPDIFTTAKALGNGYPIGATIINERVNNALEVGDHGTTFGGNPLGCKISQYVLDTVCDEKFLKTVTLKGELLRDRLVELQTKYPKLITEVRGQGLMVGCQLTQSPAELVQKCRELGLLVITAGQNTVRFLPALTIEGVTLERGLNIFSKAIDELYSS